MAQEIKTRLLLRSDILANWLEYNPTLKKGEFAVVFDPSETGDRKIRAKIGDGVSSFEALPFLADYDPQIAELEVAIAELDAKKVDRESIGAKGKSYIFNESDGGGAKFEGSNGVVAYVGIHDDIGGEIGSQIYVDKANGTESTIIDVTQNGAYYTKGTILPGIQRDVESNEIATKGVVDAKITEAISKIKHWTYKVVDVLPAPGPECENIVYLVPKGDGKTGYKEWICLNEGTVEVPNWKFEEIGDTDIDLSEYRKSADQDVIDNAIKADIAAEIARATAEEAKKVNKEAIGANGKAEIFNEADGGGAKFTNNDGVESFVGVKDGGENGLVAQIYADKLVDGKWQGAKLDVTNGAMYYTVGNKSFAERAVEENEIATKKDIADIKFDVISGGSASDWTD